MKQLAPTSESIFTFSITVQQSFIFICHIQEGTKQKNYIYTKATGDHQHLEAEPAIRLKTNVMQYKKNK